MSGAVDEIEEELRLLAPPRAPRYGGNLLGDLVPRAPLPAQRLIPGGERIIEPVGPGEIDHGARNRGDQ